MWCMILFCYPFRYKNRKKVKIDVQCLATCMGNAVHLAVTDDVFDVFLFCVILFHTKCRG